MRDTMKKYFDGRRILLVTGMLADKQIDKILDSFTDITHEIIATEPDNPRKLRAERLAEILKERGIDVIGAQDAAGSICLAGELWHGYDVVLFAGSLYLIGEVRRRLKNGK